MRNKLEACSSLSTFMEEIDKNILLNYVGVILENFFTIFLTDIPINLRETILDVITIIVEVCESSFEQFAEKSLTILIEFLAKIYSLKSHKSLYGNLINCITLMGPHCKTHYLKYIKDIVNIIVQLQETISDINFDQEQTYFQEALERICPILVTDFPDSLETVIKSVITLIKKVPQMSISEKPKEAFKLEDLLNDNTKSDKKTKLTLSTSETKELDAAIILLNNLAEKMGKVFIQYVNVSEEAVLPLLQFYINDEVRIEASNILPTILTIIKDNCSTEDLHAKAKKYIQEVLTASEKEFDNGTLKVYLENMANLVEITGVFLSTPELNNFFSKIMELFDKTEKKRLELVAEQKKVLEAPVTKEEAINSDDEDDEDDPNKDYNIEIQDIEEVQEFTSELIGKLFKTHKELTMEIVNTITSNILPKYFRDSASNFEIKMGLFIVDDLIEFLGQDLLQNIWDNLAKLVISFNTHSSMEIRRAASYGVGMFAQFTKNNFAKYSADCINCLVSGLYFQKNEHDDEDEFYGAIDNACASLGKIIKHQTNSLEIAKLIPKWLEHLPIVYDTEESEEQHLMLCQIVNNQSNLVIGENFENLPKVLKIFARIYNTKKYSNDEIDKNIQNIITSIMNNDVTKNILITTKDSISDNKENKENKLKKKLEFFLAGKFS